MLAAKANAQFVGMKVNGRTVAQGDTVNVCQRLQGLARPDRLLIGPATYQAVVGQFKIESVGPTDVKGRTRPVDTYEVFSEKAPVAPA